MRIDLGEVPYSFGMGPLEGSDGTTSREESRLPLTPTYAIYGGAERRSRASSDCQLRRRMLPSDHILPAPEFLTDADIDRLLSIGSICAQHRDFY